MTWIKNQYALYSLLLALTVKSSTSTHAPEYLSGPCMNAAWQSGNRTTTNLGCNANEVSSSVVDVQGPSSCKEGEFIYVNVTTSIYFRASRYDFAIYTSTVPGGDPIFGQECALDVLSVEDAGVITGGEIKDGDGDHCYDVFGNGVVLDNFRFQENLRIACEGNDDTGETRTVFLQNCFAWRSNGQNKVCEVDGAYPGASSKCDCASLDLGIQIIGPTPAPSISTMPTGRPSLFPSTSAQPSDMPSLMPSISTMPTRQPSISPSMSRLPTLRPSIAPSISTSPSAQPTMQPSTSAMPTDMPSESPSLTTSPSSYPTGVPSLSPSSSPTLLASISGVVWEDRNNNGVLEGDEFRLVNIPVRLHDEEGVVIKETMSDTNGRYQFEDVFPGTAHTVGVVAGTEYRFSDVVIDGGNQMTQYNNVMGTSPTVTLDEGDVRDDIHAGVYAPIEIGNRVWEDINGNGIQDDGEPGVGGVQVSLRNANGDVLFTTQSDGDGLYKFVGLPPGQYGVHFALPSGYTFTKPDEYVRLLGDVAMSFSTDLTDDVDSDAHVETGATHLIDVFSGDINLSLDAGLYRSASVEGKVWHDLNANGIQENNEPGLEGVVVTLYTDDDEYIETAMTDASGDYSFTGLLPDTYFGKILPSGNYHLSPMNAGGPESTDSDFSQTTGLNTAITIQSGQVNSGNFDAGLWMYASVGDLIWIDKRADGIQGENPLIGFPFLVMINLYDSNGQVLAVTQNDESGFYSFNELIPGSYTLEFIPDETEIFSPAFQGNNDELDSNVDPDTGRAQVFLVSGEINTSVDVGIITEDPYYPDWVFEVQVCTNDGFDPEWMTTNDGQIYLYRNKEECCKNHFWWRMAQCMANEEYKFYRNGEICDTKIDFEDWELNSPADWTDTTLFDTKDECCANLFPYDYSGCMVRSPVLFKFEFCLGMGSLHPPIDCQTADIYANVMEDAINQGLGEASDANITRVGDATLTKVDGSTQCGGSLGGQGFVNDLTGTTPDLSDVSSTSSTTICGVVTTESYDCAQDDCLTAIHDSIVSDLTFYINGGELTTTLQSLATTRLPPVPELQVAAAEPGSLSAFNLLLPTTMSNQLGDLQYAKDGQRCITKTAFATWEVAYDNLKECCKANFNWRLDECCNEGGGCGLVSDPGPNNPNGPLKYYANWLNGQLCDAKPATDFETWEESFDSLNDCCNEKFSYDIDGCCASTGMGGCSDNPGTPPTGAPPTGTPPTGAPPSLTTAATRGPPTPISTGATTVTTSGATVTSTPSTTKFYATWVKGQLCDAKPLNDFGSWEQPFDSLEDCCNEKFSYDIGGCCDSEGMGGCGGTSNGPKPLRYYATWK